MKQTAIEWLEDAFFLNAEEFNGQWTINYRDINRIIETAKEREKQQTIKATSSAYEDMFGTDGTEYGEKYYNNIFKNK